MSVAPELLRKIKTLVSAVPAFFRELAGKKPGTLIICAGGAAVLVALAVVVTAVLVKNGEREKNAAADLAARSPAGEGARFLGPPVPPEEWFLPDEPDFVPGVLLERERRSGWTEADAAPFWRDPLKNGEEPWRERVETAIDELLERVP
jgi:hypothetical protein